MLENAIAQAAQPVVELGVKALVTIAAVAGGAALVGSAGGGYLGGQSGVKHALSPEKLVSTGQAMVELGNKAMSD